MADIKHITIDTHTENCPAKPEHVHHGYPTSSFPLAENVSVYAGVGIEVEQTELGYRVNNKGLTRVDVKGSDKSGVYVTNTGDIGFPVYEVSLSTVELVSCHDLINKITFNGIDYTPIDGCLELGSSPEGLINNLISNNNTIDVTAVSVGTISIDARPPEVDGVAINPDPTDGAPFNLISGDCIEIKVDNNDVTISCTKDAGTGTESSPVTVNGITPDPTGNIAIPLGYFIQECITISAAQSEELKNGTFDLSTYIDFPISNSDLVVYLGGQYIDTKSHSLSGAKNLKIDREVIPVGECMCFIAQNRTQ